MNVELRIDNRLYASSDCPDELIQKAADGIPVVLRLEPDVDTLLDSGASEETVQQWSREVVHVRIGAFR